VTVGDASGVNTVVENVCEVVFSNACLRIRGEVSPATLRLLIRELSR
jgi:transposase